AGGVQDEYVHAALARRLEPRAGDLERRRADRAGVNLDADLVAELHELVDGGRAIDVGGHEHRLAAVLAQAKGELRRGRRLPGTLEADHHQDRWTGVELQVMPRAAEHLDELVVDDLDDLLAGIQAGEQVGADRALAHAGDEVLDDLEVDVGLEQGEADLTQRDVEVGLGDPGLAAQAL